MCLLAIRDLYESMDKTAEAMPPIFMLQVLHMCYPQFAEKGEQGGFQQQVNIWQLPSHFLFCSPFHFTRLVSTQNYIY